MVQLPDSPHKIDSTVRVSKRIYETIRSQIVDGALQAGAKLPSTRALAHEQGVSRTTVMAVYEQLVAEGYIENAPGALSRVTSAITTASKTSPSAPIRLPAKPRLSAYGNRISQFESAPSLIELASRSMISFLYGALSSTDFPTLAWRKAYDAALLQRQTWLYYATPQGELDLRTELQGYLRRARGLICSPEQILVVNGSQQAIDLCARVLLDPGDDVVIEEPCYLMAHRVFQAAGARVSGLPVDEHGLITQNLPKRPTRLAYLTPSHQFPLGGVMPIARRQNLLAWAQRSGAWVIEDDYDGEFRYGLRPVDALQSIDNAGSVIYVGTFSKALSPQLRIGYLVLPACLVSAFTQAKNLTDRHTPRLEQIALASLIRSGAYERHVRRSRRENERRRTALLQAIKQYLPEGTQVEGASSGLHVVVWLTDLRVRDEVALVDQALKMGVGLRPISPMYSVGSTHRRQNCAGFVLGYAGLDIVGIHEGIVRLAATVDQFEPNSLLEALPSPPCLISDSENIGGPKPSR